MSLATPPPIDSLSIHPALKVWPVSESVAKQLESSIQNHGFDQAHPILVWRDQIVDGRLRLDALNKLGITPEWGIHLTALDDEMSEGDIWMACARANGVRRNLSKSQRATIAVPYLPHFEADARQRMLAGKTVDGPKGEAAELLGQEWDVSASMIRLARRLDAEAPDLFVDVKMGALTINAAIKQLDIRQGKREPDNPRFNVRYDVAHQSMVEELIAYYKLQGTSLNKRLLELLAQDHARMQAGVWEQAEKQHRVAGVLSELDPALTPRSSADTPKPTPAPTKDSESDLKSIPSAPLKPPVNLRGVAAEASRKSTESPPADDDFNPFANDGKEALAEVTTEPTTESGTSANETTEGGISNEQVQRLIERYNTVAEQWNRTRGVIWAKHRQEMLNADMPLPQIVKTLCPTHDARRLAFACKQISTNPGPDLLKPCGSQPTEQLMERLVAAWQETPDEEAWFTALDALLELPAGPLLHGHLRTFSDLIRPQRTQGTPLYLWRLEGYRTWNVFKEPEPPADLRQASARAPTQQHAQEASTPAHVKIPKGEVAANTAQLSTVYAPPPETMSVRLDHNAADAMPFKTIVDGIAQRIGRQPVDDDRPLSRPPQRFTQIPPQRPTPPPPTLISAKVEAPAREPNPTHPNKPGELENMLALIPHPDVVEGWDSAWLNRLSTEIAQLSNNGQIISDQDAQRAYDQWRKGMRESDPQSAQPVLMSLSLQLRIKRRLGCSRDRDYSGLHAALSLAGQHGVSISSVLSTQVHTEAWIKLAAQG